MHKNFHVVSEPTKKDLLTKLSVNMLFFATFIRNHKKMRKYYSHHFNPFLGCKYTVYLYNSKI